jgi:hypothetical protein
VEAELRGDDHLVTAFSEDLAQQDLVPAISTVGLRRVPEIDTHVERCVECPQTLALVDVAIVVVGHRIAPKTEG